MADQHSPSVTELYEADVDDDAIPAGLRNYEHVHALVDEYETLRDEVIQLTATLKDKQERVKGILELSLPDAVREFDVKKNSLTLDDGTIIELEDQCHVNIAVADRSRAHAWLEENGGGALLKWTYTIEFGKNEGPQAKAFQRMVATLFPEREISVVLGKNPTELGKALVAVMESAFPAHTLECETTVHAGSLKAFVKKHRHKMTFPDQIKVFAPTVATITRPPSAQPGEDIFGLVPDSEDEATWKADVVGEFPATHKPTYESVMGYAKSVIEGSGLAPSDATPEIVRELNPETPLAWPHGGPNLIENPGGKTGPIDGKSDWAMKEILSDISGIPVQDIPEPKPVSVAAPLAPSEVTPEIMLTIEQLAKAATNTAQARRDANAAKANDPSIPFS